MMTRNRLFYVIPFSLLCICTLFSADEEPGSDYTGNPLQDRALEAHTTIEGRGDAPVHETAVYHWSQGTVAVRTETSDGMQETKYSFEDAVFRKLSETRRALGQDTETVQYSYDAQGRLTEETGRCGPDTDAAFQYRISYEYNDRSQVTREHREYSSGETATTCYEYSDDGRLLKTVEDAPDGTYVTTLEYDALGRETHRTARNRSDAFETRTTYYATGQVKTVTLSLTERGVSSVSSITRYYYDAGGRMSKKHYSNPPNSVTTECDYDAGGRLIKTVEKIVGEEECTVTTKYKY